MKILDFIEDTNNLTFTRIKEFEALVSIKEIKDSIKTIPIPPAIAIKFTGDFFGLLHNYLSLPSITFYFFLRLNNMYFNTDYNGSNEIKVLDPEMFNTLIKLLKEKESR